MPAKTTKAASKEAAFDRMYAMREAVLQASSAMTETLIAMVTSGCKMMVTE